MQIAIILLLILVLSLLLFLLWKTGSKSSAADIAGLSALNGEKDRQIAELKVRGQKVDELQSSNARLQAELESERKSGAEKLRLLQDAENRLKTEFQNLANRIFEEKGKTFTEQNTEKLTGLLAPFREQIEAFRTRVDEVHKNDTEGLAKLLEQVRSLQELNAKVSEEANNLAAAIKGDAKTQGNWGELIVERIFEASGLERGREYDAQTGMRSDDGRLLKPDFVVYLPGNKAVIVDAKVSLTAFERFCSGEDERLKREALAEHLASVRNHVDELKEKEYRQLLGNRTLDFVIMCVPVEGAFQLAVQNDKELLYDIARTNVVLTGPAQLMLTLKLVAQFWRREKENRNAEAIADRAGRMYDQVALVCESMDEAQKRLAHVQESFERALNRLRDGKGSLVGRVEEIRKLGAKVSKLLPQESGADPSLPE